MSEDLEEEDEGYVEAAKLEDTSFTEAGGKLSMIKQEADSSLHYNNNKSPLPGEDRGDKFFL